jgi:hypothetical protein
VPLSFTSFVGSRAREGRFLFAITDRGEGAAPADGPPAPRLRRAAAHARAARWSSGVRSERACGRRGSTGPAWTAPRSRPLDRHAQYMPGCNRMLIGWCPQPREYPTNDRDGVPQTTGFGVGELQPPFQPGLQDAIFGGQIFVSRQQFLVHHASHVGQDARPMHSSHPHTALSGWGKTVAGEIRRGYAGEAQIPVLSKLSIF